MNSRPLNHFFDPLRPWGEAGLDVPVMATQTAAVIWAQGQAAEAEKDNMSWQAAREGFYLALARGEDSSYAKTFQALGQVMHLVADAAVPAHVRNDQHVSHEWILDWVERKIKGGPDPYEHWTAQPQVWPNLDYNAEPVDPAIFSHAVPHPEALAPISALWDQNRYSGLNPEVTRGAPEATGLAEYTNANFFSKDTLGTGYASPAFPEIALSAIDWTASEPVVAEDGVTDFRFYIKGLAGDNRKRLAAFSYIASDLIARGYSAETPLVLDEQIHADYAALLIPRAVGYSVALLDYFFSGSLEITPPAQQVYAIIDDSAPAFLDERGNKKEQFFSKLRAGVRLATPYDLPQAGEILAIARYKKRADYTPDLSREPAVLPSPASFSQAVSVPVRVALDTAVPAELAFDFTASPIPAGITDLSLRIVFKGDRQGPVALGIKDLNEPMFLKLANATDRYYYSESGALKGPGDFPPGAPELALFNYPVRGSLGFCPASGTCQGQIVNFSLPPGHFSKIGFLTEGDSFSLRIESLNFPPADVSYTAVVNQEGLSTDTIRWRGDYAHQNYGWFAVFPDLDGVWDAPWPPLAFPPVPVGIWE